MAYFDPNDKEILKIIRSLTIEKPYTSQKLVYSAIPKSWKLDGCGTGNLQNCLVRIYRKEFIATATPDPAFFEGTYVGNKIFHLTERGKQELLPWFRKPKIWSFIFAAITALATFGTFALLMLGKG